MIVGNPKSGSIMQSARIAFNKAGVSVHGQLPHWIGCANNPGKSWFWQRGLVDRGVDTAEAHRIVADLNRVKSGW